MKLYAVEVTETFKTTVYIEANSKDEAEQIASEKYDNGYFIFDFDNFAKATFNATESKR